jgi:hypothetical protein
MAEEFPDKKPSQHPYYWAAFTVNGEENIRGWLDRLHMLTSRRSEYTSIKCRKK